jgi:hypothetical protein
MGQDEECNIILKVSAVGTLNPMHRLSISVWELHHSAKHHISEELALISTIHVCQSPLYRLTIRPGLAQTVLLF